MIQFVYTLCIIWILTLIPIRRPDDSNLVLTRFCRFNIETLETNCTYPDKVFCLLGLSPNEVCLEFVFEGEE